MSTFRRLRVRCAATDSPQASPRKPHFCLALALRKGPHSWPPGKMTLFPAGDSTFRGVVAETLLFPSLFRGDKVLWAFAWLFHATLALVFLGHIRAFTALADRVLMALGMHMVSPTAVSLPLKLLLFVAVDGFWLLSSALMLSYA